MRKGVKGSYIYYRKLSSSTPSTTYTKELSYPTPSVLTDAASLDPCAPATTPLGYSPLAFPKVTTPATGEPSAVPTLDYLRSRVPAR